MEDKTSAPVRESAAYVMKELFPYLNENGVTALFIEFLKNNDWQVQFSGMLVLLALKSELIRNEKRVYLLLDNLVPFLNTQDEDIKYMAAELLDFIFVEVDVEVSYVNDVFSRCWEEIVDCVEIGYSKSYILVLLKDLFKKYNLPELATYNPLHLCFTSPISMVKQSVVELCENICNEELFYLLGESIVLNDNNEVYLEDCFYNVGMGRGVEFNCVKRAEKILKQNLTRGVENISFRDFGLHFARIIGQEVYRVYDKNDFVCYKNSFFTPDGIKSLGCSLIMNNRLKLFEVLLLIPDLKLEENSDKMLFNSFKCIIEFYSRLSENDGKENAGSEEPPLEIQKVAPKGEEEASNENFKEMVTMEAVISEVMDEDFKKIPTLKKMPKMEFENILADYTHFSDYSMCNFHAVEYFRLILLRNIWKVEDASYYYCVEYNTMFLRIITRMLLRKKMPVHMLGKCYRMLVSEMKAYKSSGQISLQLRNLIVFFSMLGDDLADIIDYIMFDMDRMLFFEATIKYILITNSTWHLLLKNIFGIALLEKNVEVLKHFLSNILYNELFVRYMLQNFDPKLFSELIQYCHPVFHCLFLKKTIQSFCNLESGMYAKTLFASIIPTLYFSECKGVSPDLKKMIDEEKKIAQIIVNPKEIPEYTICCEMAINLRDYQKEGVKWMSFLSSFYLNGILADDMGLGKTLQILTFMISEMNKRAALNADSPHLLTNDCLVICPSSLTTHWKDEIYKYFRISSNIYNNKTKEIFTGITIATYDNLRRDSVSLLKNWFFLVFDEGHLLKSRTTLLYSKALMIRAEHKFILTGTPIHNSVEDLFSLFYIIMPGYLGTESEFMSIYGVKINDKNADVMEEKLSTLNKKILPFIMRRLKIEVLKDLPPKIIKDVIVDLSNTHLKVYEDVDNSTKREHLTSYTSLKNSSLSHTRNLLKAASHPRYFASSAPSSKTAALQDIFSISGEKKVLIFFQNKQTIDFVIEELCISSYLRLDGSVPIAQRGEIVSSFVNGPVRYLFLTTAIGGLGLNLVVADVVVFYEHDWNPFNDLQAMDRAHRLGQLNTVNVFRLIVRNTIEEKVMNFQNFKMHIASSIVSQQNTNVEQMDTKDLFERLG